MVQKDHFETDSLPNLKCGFFWWQQCLDRLVEVELLGFKQAFRPVAVLHLKNRVQNQEKLTHQMERTNYWNGKKLGSFNGLLLRKNHPRLYFDLSLKGEMSWGWSNGIPPRARRRVGCPSGWLFLAGISKSSAIELPSHRKRIQKHKEICDTVENVIKATCKSSPSRMACSSGPNLKLGESMEASVTSWTRQSGPEDVSNFWWSMSRQL